MTRRTRRWVFGVVMAVLAITTHLRVRDWQSNVTLWTAEVQADPRSIRGHLNLGIALDATNDLPGAGAHALRAVALSTNPRVNPWLRAFAWSAGMTNFAHAALEAGDLAQAEMALNTVLSEHPEFQKAHYNMALVALMRGECPRALSEFALAGVFPWPCSVATPR